MYEHLPRHVSEQRCLPALENAPQSSSSVQLPGAVHHARVLRFGPTRHLTTVRAQNDVKRVASALIMRMFSEIYDLELTLTRTPTPTQDIREPSGKEGGKDCPTQAVRWQTSYRR